MYLIQLASGRCRLHARCAGHPLADGTIIRGYQTLAGLEAGVAELLAGAPLCIPVLAVGRGGVTSKHLYDASLVFVSECLGNSLVA